MYARVSSRDQGDGLDARVARVAVRTTQNGYSVDEVGSEVGSGLNGRRPKLKHMLGDAGPRRSSLWHRDRYCRFGVERIEAAPSVQGRKVVVVDAAEADDDLVRDVTEVLTSLSERLHGERSARAHAVEGVAATRSGGGDG